jgi:hypothetical protein
MHHPIPAHESGVKFHPSVPLSSAKLVTNVKPVLSPLIEKVSNSKHSFMMVARTGQNIQFDDSIEAPEYLVDELSLSLSSNPILQNSEPANGFTEFSQRIRHSLRSYIGSMKMQPKPRFSPFEKANKKPHFKSFNLDTTLKNLTSDESNENEVLIFGKYETTINNLNFRNPSQFCSVQNQPHYKIVMTCLSKWLTVVLPYQMSYEDSPSFLGVKGISLRIPSFYGSLTSCFD